MKLLRFLKPSTKSERNRSRTRDVKECKDANAFLSRSFSENCSLRHDTSRARNYRRRGIIQYNSDKNIIRYLHSLCKCIMNPCPAKNVDIGMESKYTALSHTCIPKSSRASFFIDIKVYTVKDKRLCLIDVSLMKCTCAKI